MNIGLFHAPLSKPLDFCFSYHYSSMNLWHWWICVWISLEFCGKMCNEMQYELVIECLRSRWDQGCIIYFCNFQAHECHDQTVGGAKKNMVHTTLLIKWQFFLMNIRFFCANILCALFWCTFSGKNKKLMENVIFF